MKVDSIQVSNYATLNPDYYCDKLCYYAIVLSEFAGVYLYVWLTADSTWRGHLARGPSVS